MQKGNRYFKEATNESLVKHAVDLFDFAFTDGFQLNENPDKVKNRDIVGRRLPCMLLSVLLMELEDRGITIYFDKETFEHAKKQAEIATETATATEPTDNKRWDDDGKE